MIKYVTCCTAHTHTLPCTTTTIFSTLFLAEVKLRRKWRDFGAAQELAAYGEAEAALTKTDQLLECSDDVDVYHWLGTKVSNVRSNSNNNSGSSGGDSGLYLYQLVSCLDGV